MASLLSIGLVPFSQQLVKLEQSIRYVNEVNSMQAISPSTKKYMLGSSINAVTSRDPEVLLSGKPHAFMAIAEVDISMRSAVFNALAQPTSVIQQLINIQCPTGNCTWDPFESLGVCHHCNDITSQLRQAGNFGELMEVFHETLNVTNETYYKDSSVVALVTPNGHFLANKLNWTISPDDENSTVGFMATTFGTGNPNKTNTMGQFDTMFWSQTMTYVDTNEIKRKENEFVKQRGTEETPWKFWPNIPVRSEECALYYCVKSITSAVRDGIVREVPQQVTEAVRDPKSWKPKHSKLESFYASENIPEDKAALKILKFNEKYSAISMDDLILYLPDDPDKYSFHLSEGAVKSISSLFQELFTINIGAGGNFTRLQEVADKLLDQDAVVFNGYLQDLGWMPPFLSPVLGERGSALADVFEKLALSMTNEMRVNGASKNESIKGLVGTPTALYRIEWYWIIIHGTVFIAAASFCLLTMFYTLDGVPTVPLWKSSALAAISQVTGVAEVLQNAGTIEDLKKRASNEVVTIPAGKDIKLLYRASSLEPEELELTSYMPLS
jgi:hypothetical protein